MCARLAAEDLEGQMLCVAQGALVVSRGHAVGFGGGFGLSELVAFDVACAPSTRSNWDLVKKMTDINVRITMDE